MYIIKVQSKWRCIRHNFLLGQSILFAFVLVCWPQSSTASSQDRYIDLIHQFEKLCVENGIDVDAISEMADKQSWRALSGKEISEHHWGILRSKTVGWALTQGADQEIIVISVADTNGGPTAKERQRFHEGEVVFSDFTAITPYTRYVEDIDPVGKCSITFSVADTNAFENRLMASAFGGKLMAPPYGINSQVGLYGLQTNRQRQIARWRFSDRDENFQYYLEQGKSGSLSRVTLTYSKKLAKKPAYFTKKPPNH